MDLKLFMKMLVKFIVGVVLIGALLFLPVGTFNYPNAWLFLGLLFIPMLGIGIVLCIKAPELLQKRLSSKEKEKTQKRVVMSSFIVFVLGFIVTALDFRNGWSHMNKIEIIEASIIFLFGYGLYIEVLRENKYLSRTVEVQEDQKVIDTGVYSIVRHPMYLATILMFLAMPLVLGSKIGFLVFVIHPFIIAKRIKNEEEILEEGLKGYKEYKEKVKYRIIPYIW